MTCETKPFICPSCGFQENVPVIGLERLTDRVEVEANQIILDGDNDNRIHLTRILMRLFRFLLSHEGEFVAMESIMHHMYSHRLNPPQTGTLTVNLSRLRKVLGPTLFEIERDWGFGYRLRVGD